jgi:hypothetical protein
MSAFATAALKFFIIMYNILFFSCIFQHITLIPAENSFIFAVQLVRYFRARQFQAQFKLLLLCIFLLLRNMFFC